MDLEKDDSNPATRLRWAICYMGERYICMIPENPEEEKPPIETFFNGLRVIVRTLEQNGIGDPDLPRLLSITLVWAKVMLEPLTKDDASSDIPRVRQGALWRKEFFRVVNVNGGVDSCLKAIDIANAALIDSMTTISA